jgi:hypothetical protein
LQFILDNITTIIYTELLFALLAVVCVPQTTMFAAIFFAKQTLFCYTAIKVEIVLGYMGQKTPQPTSKAN